MKTSKIRDKGQITIPVEIRHDLEIKINSKVYTSIVDDKIILQPLNRKYYRSLIGIGNTSGRAINSLMEEKKKESKL